MANPWLSIPLADYEGHMDAVQQLNPLSELFAVALEFCDPGSVAILGIAGGNGLEQVDGAKIRRIVGVDINERYLDEVRQRFASLDLELHRADLSKDDLSIAPVRLVHAALFFEHAGLGRALDSALSLVDRGGCLSVVLQVSDSNQPGVSVTPFPSIQTLAGTFSSIDISQFRGGLEKRGFQLVKDDSRRLVTGKTLWFGVFTDARQSGGSW